MKKKEKCGLCNKSFFYLLYHIRFKHNIRTIPDYLRECKKSDKKKFLIEGQKFEKIPDATCSKCGEEIFRSIFTGKWKHYRERQFCRGATPGVKK